jgi:anti-anti-sigma factor
MSAEIKRKNGYLWITLPNAIGIDEGQEIQLNLESKISLKNEQLVLDFTNTSIIYSAGFGLFIRLRKKVMETQGVIYFVNVSKKIRDTFTELMLDKVFPIYATDVEFELSTGDVWKENLTDNENVFIFVPNLENGVYRLTFSGQITSLHDLSALNEFNPEKNVDYFLIDFQNIDLIDTYGAQLLNDFIGRIKDFGKRCIIFGTDKIHKDIFDLYNSLNTCEFYETEKEALNSIK